MKVTFKNLGRNDATVTENIDRLCYENLYSIAKRYLLSSDIEFRYDPDSKQGYVLVGTFRVVGSFEIEDEEKKTNKTTREY